MISPPTHIRSIRALIGRVQIHLLLRRERSVVAVTTIGVGEGTNDPPIAESIPLWRKRCELPGLVIVIGRCKPGCKTLSFRNRALPGVSYSDFRRVQSEAPVFGGEHLRRHPFPVYLPYAKLLS